MNPNTRIFLDTSYVYALLNTRDQWHEVALELQFLLAKENQKLLTTEFVLMEIGDGMSRVRLRERAALIIRGLRQSELVNVIPASTELLERSLMLYESRPDKSWGLTDSSSFIVMKDLGITDALTADDHFRQAGFNALMLK